MKNHPVAIKFMQKENTWMMKKQVMYQMENWGLQTKEIIGIGRSFL